jgi:hypothetical protein
MRSAADLREHAARLRALADRAPTWRQRNDMLEIAREYDRLAAVAAAGEDGRIAPAGTA